VSKGEAVACQAGNRRETGKAKRGSGFPHGYESASREGDVWKDFRKRLADDGAGKAIGESREGLSLILSEPLDLFLMGEAFRGRVTRCGTL